MSRGARFSPRRIPIRWRITLWYTILMTVLVAAVLALVIAYFALRNRGKIQLFGKRKGTGTALRQ